jgi:hypothetical protein
MPSISYDTTFEVWLSDGFILYYILVHACIAAETLRGNLSSGYAGVCKCVVFPRCATKGSPWIFSYIKQSFTVCVDIFAVSIYRLLL